MTLLLARGTREVFDPTSLVEEYLDVGRPRRHRFAWPHYDGLVTNADPDTLVTGDLLAPELLAVSVDLDRMAALTALLPRLQEGLTALPGGVRLAEADDDLCDAVAALWAPLHDEDVAAGDVKGSLIAKVMHRKRPGLIPLYDSRVFRFYRHERAVPPEPTRRWDDYMALLTRVMRDDLADNADTFAELVALAPPDGPALSALRALDIVVWMSEAPIG